MGVLSSSVLANQMHRCSVRCIYFLLLQEIGVNVLKLDESALNLHVLVQAKTYTDLSFACFETPVDEMNQILVENIFVRLNFQSLFNTTLDYQLDLIFVYLLIEILSVLDLC